ADFASELNQPKTREVNAALGRWGISADQSALLIVAEKDENVMRASRNIARLKVIDISGLNVFDLLNVDWVVMTAPALQRIQEVYGE
ncbi:MAG: 50S ribosomal protein L4, partial [Cyanobacteria bacterium P01_D01_bin.123]